MSDLIDRQAAINALGKAPKFKIRMVKTYAEGRNDQWFDDVAALVKLPSADVQPVRHGTWIEDRYNNLDFVCSECGEPCGTMVMDKPRDRYCKWCGAKMEA